MSCFFSDFARYTGLSLWLVNSWRLFNLLRQYSGEKAEPLTGVDSGQHEKQNSHRLQSFDITPIREQLRLRVEECYQNLMKRRTSSHMSPKSCVMPGILQHETASDVLGVTVNGRQPAREGHREAPKRGLDDLMDFLNFVHAKLDSVRADSRKELCNFEKAVQIKHNVTEIQTWLFSKGLGAYRELLDPLVQACHLLQSRKDESNIDTLCGEMTSKLKPRQVGFLIFQ
ncbi:DIL domain protein [Cooperia oncophora]